jgi:hypothetical protein
LPLRHRLSKKFGISHAPSYTKCRLRMSIQKHKTVKTDGIKLYNS